jgi:hypothetical protein
MRVVYVRKNFTLNVISILIALSLILSACTIYIYANVEQGVVVSFEPETVNLKCGDSFIISVNVYNVKDLNKWEITLSWNAKIVDLDPPDASSIEEGEFLKSAGATKFAVSTYDAGSGVLQRISCYLVQAKGVSGSGTLFRVRFKAVSGGSTYLLINNSKLYDYVFRSILHKVQSCQVSVASVLRDVSIVAFACSDVILGRSTCLNVTVKNNGEILEKDVVVRLYLNGSIINSSAITTIDVNSERTCSFIWTPESVGFYNVTILVNPLPDETIIHDNVVSRIVKVVSHDLKVSLQCPYSATVNSTVSLIVTVSNVGTFKEENVRVRMKIDNLDAAVWTIPSIDVGESKVFQYLWKPDRLGVYNVEAYVEPCIEEFDITNNIYKREVRIISDQFWAGCKILIVADDDGSWHQFGTSLVEFEEALSAWGYKYDIWKESEKGYPTLDYMLDYDVVIWTVGDFCNYAVDKNDASTLKQYVTNGGNLIIEGQFIALENYKTDLRSDVLHISWQGSFITGSQATGVIIPCAHAITRGLPNEINWTCQNNGHDKVYPAYGAYEVARFLQINSTAINVFDGCQNGHGSVIYFAFSIRWLPERERNILIKNCIEWFGRKDLSVVASRIKFSPEKEIYFIYGQMPQPSQGAFIPQGTLIHNLCINYQNELNCSEGLSQTKHLQNTIFVLCGNPNYNSVIKYYENYLNMTPIRFFNTSKQVIFYDKEGNFLYSLSMDAIQSGHEDAFVIYIFEDKSLNNTYLVVYGVGLKGSWAAEIYYSKVIINNLPLYSGKYYIFSWFDKNGDGIPQIEEIVEENFG